MDMVYKIVESQQKVTAIFMANPETKRVNKNTYSVKDRKAGGYLDE